MKNKRIYAMIPARYGSTRLKMKNLALINNEPMISFAIKAALNSNAFDRVIVNSEHEIFNKIATRYGVEFYHRPNELGSSVAKSDSVVKDFMKFFPEADIVCWINPTSPFQTGNEVSNIVNYFMRNDLDSLITVEDKQVHCNYKNKPINYNKDILFSQTQDLTPVQPFVYSVMMWNRETFMTEFDKNGHALFCGNFGVYPVGKLSSIIVKNESDLKLADLLMRSIKNTGGNYLVKYDKLVV
jgi:CMP-N-acetylneuraminic acid synthetase